MAKHKLLAGLLLGGAAVAAYHTLDLEQREALKDAARDRCNALKDRAVDYAFYAADALDDFKEDLNDRLADKAAAADDYQADDDSSTAADHKADDDIVLSSDEVADIETPTAPMNSVASEPAAETTPTDSAEDHSEA